MRAVLAHIAGQCSECAHRSSDERARAALFTRIAEKCDQARALVDELERAGVVLLFEGSPGSGRYG